jgi:hypothetical protein
VGTPLVFSLPFKEISMRRLLISTLEGLNASLKGNKLRILILIGLLAVSIMQLRLTLRLEKLSERLGPIQEKSLELYVEPDYFYEVPMFNFEEGREIAI